MARHTPLNNYITNDPIQNYKGIGAGMISYVTDDNNNIYAIPYKTYPDFQNLPMPAWDMVDTKNYYKD